MTHTFKRRRNTKPRDVLAKRPVRRFVRMTDDSAFELQGFGSYSRQYRDADEMGDAVRAAFGV